MVLTSRITRSALKALLVSLALAVLASGCVKSRDVVKLPEKTPIAVAYVMDDEFNGLVGEPPAQLKEEVAKVLAERNLEPVEIPFQSYSQVFVPVRDSKKRLARLANGEAPYTLLVEANASFFAQLSGRYRWTVSFKLGVSGKDESLEPMFSAAELSTFVDFEHEKEQQVVASIADDLARRAGALLDEYLSAASAPEKKKLSAEAKSEGEGVSPYSVHAGPKAAAHNSDGDLGAIYFIMVDRFANGDAGNDGDADKGDASAFHGGDIQGVIDHLDELKDMGVKTVWLSPVFKMRTDKFFGHGAFHGYWVEDFDQVEPRFGDTATLVKLSDELHARGMKLILDIVLNHVAMDSPKLAQHPGWFHGNGALENWNDPGELTTHDVHGLPDLNQDNPEVYDFLLKTSLAWLDTLKPDGFRLDAVKHIDDGFWVRYNKAILEAAPPGFILLGEVLDGDHRQISATMRNGMFNSMFDFPLYFALVDVYCRDQNPAKLASVFSSDRTYDKPELLATILDNHDLPRIASDCKGDMDRIRQALTFQLTSRGFPVINYGTEAALEGAKEPENRADMRFDSQPLREHIKSLLALRDRHESLRNGAPIVLDVDASSMFYARVSSSEAALVAVNKGDAPRTFQIPYELADGVFADALTGAATDVSTGLTVPPRSTVLVIASAASESGFAAFHDKALTQWRSGNQKRAVHFKAKGLKLKKGETAYVVGSGLEMGVWKPKNALGPLDRNGQLTAMLPTYSAYEFKLVVRGEGDSVRWADGANSSLFVSPGTAPLQVDVNW